MSSNAFERKDWQILMDAGLEVIDLPSNDTNIYVTLYNAAGWNAVKEASPEEYEMLRELAALGEGIAGLPF